jgi:hypothetical protein
VLLACVLMAGGATACPGLDPWTCPLGVEGWDQNVMRL